jgi:hypothetical protein
VTKVVDSYCRARQVHEQLIYDENDDVWMDLARDIPFNSVALFDVALEGM